MLQDLAQGQTWWRVTEEREPFGGKIVGKEVWCDLGKATIIRFWIEEGERVAEIWAGNWFIARGEDADRLHDWMTGRLAMLAPKKGSA